MPLSPDLRDFTDYCDSFRFSALFTVYFFGKGSHIRRTDVVDKSTYWRKPLAECSPRSAATADYAAFVCEFLGEEDATDG